MSSALDHEYADTTAARDNPPALAFAAAAAAIALGHALQISGGTYHPTALRWLTLALICAVVALFVPHRAGRLCDSATLTLLGIGLIVQLAQLTSRPPGIYLNVRSPADLRPFNYLVIATGVLAAAGFLRKPWLGRWRVPILLATFFLSGAWVINASPQPFIDVYTYQQDSCAAFEKGINPYTITFPDIYGGTSAYFPPGVHVGGRLQFGYLYWPTTLFLSLPGYVLSGDHRFSQLACVTAAAAFMTYARPSVLSSIAAAMFLLTPRSFQVIEDAWIEPFLVFLLSATVFCAFRAPRALPFVLGVFLASKQYAPLLAPLALLLLPRPWTWGAFWGVAWRAALAAAVVTLPLALWDLGAFLHSTVKYHLSSPFRMDSLSYLAWWARSTRTQPPNYIGFLAMAGITALALWRAPRTPAGFALAVGVVSTAFFAFSKQAFLNYYYFVVGALWCAIAVSIPRESRGPRGAVTSGAQS